jgi:hypothetical protein
MKKGGSRYKIDEDESKPEIPPDLGIKLLQRQIDEARSLVSKRPIDSSAFHAWRDATQTYLNKAFGKNQKSLSFESGGFVPYGDGKNWIGYLNRNI